MTMVKNCARFLTHLINYVFRIEIESLTTAGI